MKSPVPTTSCHRATTSPRRREPLRSASSTSWRAEAYARSAAARRSAAAASCSDAARSTAPARAGRLRRAPLSVLRIKSPRASASAASASSQRRTGASSAGGQPPCLEPCLADDEQDGVDPLLADHLPEMRRHLALGIVRYPVEHDRERRASLACRREELPRHGVGVARRRGHEEPGIGGCEELCRERAVLGEHGVDVRRVEERETRLELRRRHDQERAGRRCAACHSRQAGQDPVALEPAHVVGVADENRARASWAAARPTG